MNRIKKLFSPQAGDTYHSHQAGVPDGVYHRKSVDDTAGTGSSSTEDKPTSGQPITSSYASEQQPSPTTEGASYGEAARRVYSGTSQSSGPTSRIRTTSTASKPSSPTKYIAPTNFASGGPSYTSKPSTTNSAPTTRAHDTINSTRDPDSTSGYDTASPQYNNMTSNSSNQLPPGAFVDDTPNSARSAVGGAAPSMGTTGAPQIGKQDLGERLDAYPASTANGSGNTGTGYDGSTSAAGTGFPGASGRSGADYKGTDNFTPHPHDVDASNKPLAAPEDPDAVRTSAPATTIAARVMGAGGGETATGTGAFSGTTTSSQPGYVGGTRGAGSTGAAGHEAYAHGRHPDAAPYSTERHVERELYESEQTKGGPLGSVHKHQESKYADSAEPNTTARDKYYGDDGATHPMSGAGSSTGTGVGGHHETSGHGGQAIGGGAGHRAYDDASTGTGTKSHDYGTGQSGTKDSSQASPADSGRTSLDGEGRPKKRGLMDKILHR